jgi:hypothetical protein
VSLDILPKELNSKSGFGVIQNESILKDLEVSICCPKTERVKKREDSRISGFIVLIYINKNSKTINWVV